MTSNWEIGKTYTIDEYVSYDGLFYKCRVSHKSQKDWYPCIDTLSLWLPVDKVPKQTTPTPTPVPTPAPKPVEPTPVPKPEAPKPKPPMQNPPTYVGKLTKLLNGKAPIGTYYQAWSAPWSSKSADFDLAKVSTPINIVYLSFAQPNCTYKAGSNTFSNTGLSFSSDFSVVKGAVEILKKKGIIVMLSVGGATYPFTTYNAKNVADLCNDLGCNGIDIDWEDEHGFERFGGLIKSTRDALPNGCISAAGFSVGAYGEGDFKNAQPGSSRTSMNIQGLKSNGFMLDWINIMSYDASPVYDPIVAFKAYRSFYKGPLMIGGEVPPEAWGGNVIKLDDVKKHATYAKSVGPEHGYFTWSYQKQGTPSSNDILNTAAAILNASSPIVIPVVTPPNQEIPKYEPIEVPGTTVLAPYLYTWGKTNSVYKIKNFMDITNTLKGNAATLAFIIGNSTADIITQFKDEIQNFNNAGGQPIVSFGGANGPYMEDTISEDEMVQQISNLIDQTGIHALDFDVEGSYLANIDLNHKRANVIVKLQRKYPGLYISYTLPADMNGLTNIGIECLKNAVSIGVRISIVNIMAMDIGDLPAGYSWGLAAGSMGDTTVQQIQSVFPNCNEEQLYKKLGITVMIGKNDDASVFTPMDATHIGEYAKRKNIGLLSFWSINRDQVGTGNLGIYSQVNTKDYEFYNNMKLALGNLGTLPNNELPPVAIPEDTWKSCKVYKVGDKVMFNGHEYIYNNTHMSTPLTNPEVMPIIWKAV